MIVIAKKNLRKSLLAIAMTSALLPTLSANAATQGTLGATSTGSITINASIPALVQISNLSDLTFTTLNGTADASLSENVCVFSNTLTRSYTIRATGNGTSSAFTLINGDNATVPYSVAWASTPSATSGTALTTNTPSGTLTSAALTPQCLAGTTPTATLLVGITAVNQSTMVANTTYTGTLTLLVTPV